MFYVCILILLIGAENILNFAEQNRLDAVMAQVFDEAIKKLWAGELAKLPEDEVPADRLAEIQHSKFESGFAYRLLIPNSIIILSR